MSCTDTSVCCNIINFSVTLGGDGAGSGGMNMHLFKGTIQLITFVSMVLLMLSLRSSLSSSSSTTLGTSKGTGSSRALLPFYFNMVVVTSVFYLAIIGLQWVPMPQGQHWQMLRAYMTDITLGLQWLVQVSLLMMLWQRDFSSSSEKRCYVYTTVIVALLVAINTIGIMTGTQLLLLFLCDLLLACLFGVALVLQLTGWFENTLSHRRAARVWAVYQFLAHSGFSAQFLMTHLGAVATGACLTVFNDCWYYLSFAIVFYWTIDMDSKQWRQEGIMRLASLPINSDHAIHEADRLLGSVMKDVPIASAVRNIRAIAYSEITLDELCGEVLRRAFIRLDWIHSIGMDSF